MVYGVYIQDSGPTVIAVQVRRTTAKQICLAQSHPAFGYKSSLALSEAPITMEAAVNRQVGLVRSRLTFLEAEATQLRGLLEKLEQLKSAPETGEALKEGSNTSMYFDCPRCEARLRPGTVAHLCGPHAPLSNPES